MATKSRILIIDDNKDFCKKLHERLQDFGYEIVTSQRGKLALTVAMNQKFDLILLDLTLPDIDGLKVLAALRERTKTQKLPVIIVSGRHHREDIKHALELKAYAFIKKPVKFKSLMQKIKMALLEHRQRTGLTMP